MKQQQILSAAVGIHLVMFAGCGKKDAGPNPGDKSAEPAKRQSVDELVAPTQTGAPAPAPPVPEAAPAPSASSAPAAATPAPSSPDGGFTSAVGSRQQFDRNMNWITRVGSGDPEEKKKALAEIQRAKLSSADMAALRQMAQYYGVKL